MKKKIYLLVLLLTAVITLPSYSQTLPDDWAKQAVEEAISQGIVSETDNLIYINDITKQQFMKIANHMAEILGAKNSDASSETTEDAFISRQDACVAFLNIIKSAYPECDSQLYRTCVFDDISEINYKALEAVSYLYDRKIITGYQDYLINPTKNLTVQEAVIMAKKIVDSKETFTINTMPPSNKINWVIKPQFDGMIGQTKFSGGLAAVKKNGNYGYINKEGKTAVAFKYDMAYPFSGGFGKIQKNGDIGYVDKTGKLVISPKYSDGGNFSYGLTWVEKDGKFGYINSENEIIIPFEYDWASDFSEGVAAVKKGEKWGYIDCSGAAVLEFIYDWAGSFSQGYARIEKQTKYGFIDRQGTEIVKPTYDYVYDFSNQRAVVYQKEYYGVIDTEGNIVIPIKKYSKFGDYHNGLIKARTGGMWLGHYGFLDISGENKIKHLFRDVGNFSEGLAWYRVYTYTSDRHGYMDKNGNFILPYRELDIQYSENDKEMFSVNDFSEGLAAVTTNEGLMGFIANPLF